MATEISIVVGDSFADRHESFQEVLGNEYDEEMRDMFEDRIHSITKRLERTSEAQQAQMAQQAEALSGSSGVESDGDGGDADGADDDS